jgi:S-adenosylmethionine-dependent methyltransferase
MASRQRGKHDQNFDTLIDKFEDRIYGTLKGEWRLKLLREDLSALRAAQPLDIWDAGCGLGQMALWFAQNHHRLTCCDISYKMLSKAQNAFAEAGCEAIFRKAPSQEIAHTLPPQDLVLFHAVIEWLADPLASLEIISDRVKPAGHLSLLFFNYHSFVYRNAMKGAWRLPFLLEESQWYGKGKKLTPPHPQKPEVLIEWLESHGYEIEVVTGIRVFHDYMSEEVLEQSKIEELLALEYRYCRDEVYKMMGRYVHILARKL